MRDLFANKLDPSEHARIVLTVCAILQQHGHEKPWQRPLQAKLRPTVYRDRLHEPPQKLVVFHEIGEVTLVAFSCRHHASKHDAAMRTPDTARRLDVLRREPGHSEECDEDEEEEEFEEYDEVSDEEDKDDNDDDDKEEDELSEQDTIDFGGLGQINDNFRTKLMKRDCLMAVIKAKR